MLAQAIGRLGNYFNQELYGRETTVPWGLEIFERVETPSGSVDDCSTGCRPVRSLQVVHPTFLYELLWNLLIVVLLVLVDRKFKIGHGRLFALYVAGYCAGRFWIELMRDDTATEIAGIRVNTFTSTFVFVRRRRLRDLRAQGQGSARDTQPRCGEGRGCCSGRRGNR